MTVLVIRQHSRFAVCRKSKVRSAGARRASDALLIELSIEGCRLSGLGDRKFSMEEPVELKVEGVDMLTGRVRWMLDGALGVRFDRPLTFAALDRLIRLCRAESPAGKTATALAG